MSQSDHLEDRRAELSPAKRALLEKWTQGKFKAAASGIPRREGSAPAVLSFAQQRLWFLDQLMPDSAAYNMLEGVRLIGALDVTALERAINEIVRRHEVLRAGFRLDGDTPVQVIDADLRLDLPLDDLRHLAGESQRVEITRLVAAAAQRPFDLQAGPALRARLLRVADDEHIFLLTMHHIVSDAWSFGLFVHELAALYDALSRGGSIEAAGLRDLPVQYPDFAVWQRGWLQGDMLDKQLGYWKTQLGGSLPVLELPSDRPRPMTLTSRGARHTLTLPKPLVDDLTAWSRQHSATLFMTLLAAFKTLLYRYTRLDDVIVGTPIANRERVEVERLIGVFANTLALRTDLSGDPSFSDLVGRVRETALGAYAHQDLPFEQLVEELQPARDLAHTPIFQVLFALQNVPKPSMRLSSLTLAPLEIEHDSAKFDLTMTLEENAAGISGWLEYNVDLFDPDTIERLAAQYRALLESVLANPDQRLSEIALLSDAERAQLDVWNATDRAYPRDATLPTLIAEIAARDAERTAAECDGETISYGDLIRRANQLAQHLRGLGVTAETPVAICMDRSFDLLAGLLGIVTAGGFYVPLDPAYPADRLAFMLSDSGARVIVTEQHLVEHLPPHSATTVLIDADWPTIARQPASAPDAAPTPESLAYMIYTSGSTGTPKGVQIPHRALINFLDTMRETPGLRPDDVLIAVTTLSFDIAGLELWLPLTSGARLVLARRDTVGDGPQLMDLMRRSGATVMQATPATWRLLLASGWDGDDRLRILCGGEALPADLVDQLIPRCAELWNMYGPTETTIWSTCTRLTADTPLTIGRPIGNTQVYVLDEHLRPVPIGLPGELYIGGDGLARGYWNRPALTAEKFVSNPFAAALGRSARLYRTGDLARWRSDGTIEYLGRIDHQVKVRGYRIELGEIEAALADHPAVTQAVTIVREDSPGDRRLAAYIVPDERRAATVRRFVERERSGDLAATQQYELPNGMAIVHQSKPETDARYESLFGDRSLLRHGVVLPDGATIFDVGANIGLLGVFAAAESRDARIFGFEPIPQLADAAQHNAALYDIGGRILRFGLADRPALETISYYPQAAGLAGRFASDDDERAAIRDAVLAQYADAAIDEAELDALLTERLQPEQLQVVYRTLSEVRRELEIERIDLLRIDAGPAARNVLGGIDADDWQRIGQIVVSVIDQASGAADTAALLDRHGYRTTIERGDGGIATIYAVGSSAVARGVNRQTAEVVYHSPHTLIVDLRRALKERLPEYMIPATFTLLTALPLTPNGKIDRRALPKPEAARPDQQASFVAPQSEMEQQIAAIWQEVLQIERVGVYDNFFDLGGHSLLMVQVHSRLRAALSREIAVIDLFKYPSISELARYLSQKQPEQSSFDRVYDRAEKRRGAGNRLAQLRQERRR